MDREEPRSPPNELEDTQGSGWGRPSEASHRLPQQPNPPRSAATISHDDVVAKVRRRQPGYVHFQLDLAPATDHHQKQINVVLMQTKSRRSKPRRQ